MITAILVGAALCLGTMIGAGFSSLKLTAVIEEQNNRISQMIPKEYVIDALNSSMVPEQRTDQYADHWNGAIEAVRWELRECLNTDRK